MLTRRKSDEVYNELLPDLSVKLCNRGINVTDLMSISRAYFGNKAFIAGSLGGQSFFSEEEQQGKTIFEIKPHQSSGGLRQIFVTSGKTFLHPECGTLPLRAAETVQELNKFVVEVETMSEEQIRIGTLKFYLILAELHLPVDGSGRFIGDADTMIQMAVKRKLNGRKRKFEVIPISNTGYREGNLETVMRNAQLLFEGFLIETIFGEIASENSKEFSEARKFVRSEPDLTIQNADLRIVRGKVRRAFSLLNANTDLLNLYYKKLTRHLGDLIKVINNNDDIFHDVATANWGRVKAEVRKFGHEYADTKKLQGQGVDIDLFDRMVATERYLDSGLSKTDLASDLQKVRAEEIIEDTRSVLSYLLSSLKHKNLGLFEWVMSRNDHLKAFAKVNGLFTFTDAVVGFIGQRKKRVIA